MDLQVGLGERSYPIILEAGSLNIIGNDLAGRKIGNKYAVISDDTVANLYGELVLKSLKEAGISGQLFRFKAGEASKSLTVLEDLAGRMATHGFDRHDAIIALGGGVSGDLAGFLAATYMRGIPFVQVPTTLLAQVDSSVGGKTGVDIAQGKNLIGVFYQPKAVYIDTNVLHSLPKQELLGGLAEVIKYGVIRDANFFEFLEKNQQEICNLQSAAIARTIKTCCSIKAKVVEEDEREGDIRRILNYGHTIGHAVEGASNYSLIHGLAVSIGMVAAARIAESLGVLRSEDRKRIVDILELYGLPTQVPPDLDRSLLKQYLRTDKKNIGGTVVFVLPTTIGATIITDEVETSLIDMVIA